MKKIIILFLMIFVFNSAVVCAEENVLNLDDASKMVETSYSIRLMDRTILKLKNSYDMLKKITDNIPIGMINSLDDQSLANMGLGFTKADRLEKNKLVFVKPKEILAQYNNLKNTKITTINSLKLGAEGILRGIKLNDEAIRLQESVVEVSKNQYKNAQQKFQNGLISKNDLTKSKLSYDQSILKLNTQKRSRQNMIFTLNKMLGVNINKDYSDIDIDLEKIEDFDFNIDLEKVKQEALNKRIEIAALKEKMDILDVEFLFTQMFYRETEPQYKIVENKIESARIDLQELEMNIGFEIDNAFETVSQNFDAIDAAKIDLENAQNRYNDVKEKYNQGLVTEDILDLSNIAVNGAKIKVLSAINDFNMSVKKFNYAVAFGPKFN